MKISVFGKSGPSVVTLGLVCAKSSAGPVVAATTAAITMNNAREIIDIPVSRPILFCRILS
jgi:hypothetical protein